MWYSETQRIKWVEDAGNVEFIKVVILVYCADLKKQNKVWMSILIIDNFNQNKHSHSHFVVINQSIFMFITI